MFTTIGIPELRHDEKISTDFKEENSDYEDTELDETMINETDHHNRCDIIITTKENLDESQMEWNRNDNEILNAEHLSRESEKRLKEMEIDSQEEEQTITDLIKANAIQNGQLIEMQNNNRMRVAFGIILRLVLPLANGVVRRFQGIRDARFLRILQGVTSSRQSLASLLAFAANTISMNLSSVQVSHRLESILRLMKIRKSRNGLESLPDTTSTDQATPFTPSTSGASTPAVFYSPLLRSPKGGIANFKINPRKTPALEQPAPKCCNLKILAEPPPGQSIRADIIFIHGLHGSLANTWKQGLWENDRRPVEFQRPPKPPVRPPKRARHSRSTHIRPPHKQKRARLHHLEELYKQSTDAEMNEDINDSFTYVCGDPKDIETCDGVEYSFPTFRIRMNDHKVEQEQRQQHKMDSIFNEKDSTKNHQQDSNITKDEKTNKSKSKSTSKVSPNDPNYSKCWPGDWLPLDCPGVRVIAINYTTDQYLWRPLWKKKEPRTNLIQRAREMSVLLAEQRVGHGHPIVWVGHSKGGLYVKQIIVDAWESGRPAMAPFWRSARGCFFYSVPHRGSHLASIKAPLLTRSVELLDIEKNSKYLLDLHRRFAGLYHSGHLKIEVFSFVETALTLMSVLYLRIVGVDSADPGIGDVCGIRLDHREICKPRSRDCILYKELVNMINKVC